ncbi:tachykinin-like peptides receptor 86C [Rhipicephalus microplus]|uniref:tachykinin-like peptides receptor 86C n=1 Tax=Rhipicephalus microplus TaxID=6941 RepID=UPI003F6ABF3C
MVQQPERDAAFLDTLLNSSLSNADNSSLLRTLLKSLNDTSTRDHAPVIEVQSQRQWVLPWWTQLVYACLFGFMVATAVLGNAAVVWIVLAHRTMRTVTNYFLLNLSLADALTATFNAIFNLVYMLESHWAFGEGYCVFNNFIANLTVASSAFTMAAMSIDRYFAVVHPLCSRLSRWRSVAIIGALWGCSALLSLPPLLYSRTRSYRYADGSVRTVCLLVWPDGPPYASYDDYLYNVVFLVLTYGVPVVTLAITYWRMSMVLWGDQCIGEFTRQQEHAHRTKQKVVKMLFTVVLLFAVCWLPYHAYFLYISHNPHVAYLDHIQHVYLAMYWLAMSHAMCNPIVYYCMNKRFKGYFRAFLCGRCWSKAGTADNQSATTSPHGQLRSVRCSSAKGTQSFKLHSFPTRAALVDRRRVTCRNGTTTQPSRVAINDG